MEVYPLIHCCADYILKHAKIAVLKEWAIHINKVLKFWGFFSLYSGWLFCSLTETADIKAYHLILPSLPLDLFISPHPGTIPRALPIGIVLWLFTAYVIFQNFFPTLDTSYWLPKNIQCKLHAMMVSSTDRLFPPFRILWQVRRLRLIGACGLYQGSWVRSRSPCPWVISVLFLGLHTGTKTSQRSPLTHLWLLCYLKVIKFVYKISASSGLSCYPDWHETWILWS